MRLKKTGHFINSLLNKENNNIKDKIITFLIVIVSLFFLSFCSQIFIFILDFFIEKEYNVSITKLIKKVARSNEEYNFVNSYNLLFYVFYVPVFEELIFRLYLDLKKSSLIISSTLFYFVVVFPYNNITILTTNNELLKLFIFIILLIFLVLFNFEKKAFIKKYYYLFFVFSSLFFGLIHIMNFSKDIPSNLMIFTPFFVLPQITLGFLAGYIRLKNGIIWSVLLHLLFNLPVMILYFLK